MKVDFRKKEYFITEPDEILTKVCKLSGFRPGKLIYKGEVRREDWIGSLIYQGKFQNRSAILKIQGLKPEQEEPEIIEKFMAQNRSRIIRSPYIFWHRPWDKKEKFGAFVMEKVNAPQIFKYPGANYKQKQLFNKFYDEFHLKALNKPWERVSADERNSIQFFQKRVRRLKKERPDIKLPQEDRRRINLFSELIDRRLLSFPVIFTHGHLGADDIRFDGRRYILMSNLAWGYKPECYDAMFTIWGCLHKIRNDRFSLEKGLELINEWFDIYNKSKYLNRINQWRLKAKYSLLYFILASLVLQLYSDEHKRTATKKQLVKLFLVHRELFDYFYNQLYN